jgi:hypothetical protein
MYKITRVVLFLEVPFSNSVAFTDVIVFYIPLGRVNLIEC